MARKCDQCGFDNDDSSPRCRCGHDLAAAGSDVVAEAASPAATAPAPASPQGRQIASRIVFACWWLGFLPLVYPLQSHLPDSNLLRTVIGIGIFYAPILLALWILRRDPGRAERVWRLVFVVWALLCFSLLFTIVDGVAQEGWPQGRFNRTIAEMLKILLGLLIPVFLTGFAALMRAYLAASLLALLAGLNQLILGIYLIRAAVPIKNVLRPLISRLDIIATGAKLLSYLTIPVGILLIVGAILLFRARRSRVSV